MSSTQKSYNFCENKAIYDVIMQEPVRKWRHNHRHEIRRDTTQPFSFLDISTAPILLFVALVHSLFHAYGKLKCLLAELNCTIMLKTDSDFVLLRNEDMYVYILGPYLADRSMRFSYTSGHVTCRPMYI